MICRERSIGAENGRAAGSAAPPTAAGGSGSVGRSTSGGVKLVPAADTAGEPHIVRRRAADSRAAGRAVTDCQLGDGPATLRPAPWSAAATSGASLGAGQHREAGPPPPPPPPGLRQVRSAAAASADQLSRLWHSSGAAGGGRGNWKLSAEATGPSITVMTGRHPFWSGADRAVLI